MGHPTWAARAMPSPPSAADRQETEQIATRTDAGQGQHRCLWPASAFPQPPAHTKARFDAMRDDTNPSLRVGQAVNAVAEHISNIVGKQTLNSVEEEVGLPPGGGHGVRRLVPSESGESRTRPG